MASIEKRKDSYRITVSLGFDTEGNQIREKTTYHPTATTTKAIEKEVAAFARDFEKQVKEGKWLSGEKLTFKAIAERWLKESAPKNLADKGEQNMDIIKRYAYPAFGTLKISKITTLHIQDMISGMETKGLAPGTIRRAMAAINSVFRYAYRLRIIQENPCTRDRIELPKEPVSNDLHYFTPKQAQVFLEFMQKPFTKTVKAHQQIDDTGKPYNVPEYTQTMYVPLQHQVFFMLAVYGGFRRGELGALTWEDVDYKNRTVTINKALARRKGGQVIKSPKTAHGNRTVMLPEICFSFLRRWQREQLEYRLRLGSAWRGNMDMDKTNIFMQDYGDLMDISTVRKRFRSIVERYNAQCKSDDEKLPLIRVHDLRHTSATLLEANGCDIATISKRLGHSKVSVTLDVYSHALPENDEAASDILEKVLARKSG